MNNFGSVDESSPIYLNIVLVLFVFEYHSDQVFVAPIENYNDLCILYSISSYVLPLAIHALKV
jgi:hypothetical protein